MDRMFTAFNHLLDSGHYDSVRILMAFARSPGVALISSSLANFIKSGGDAEAILGLDLGGTSADALQSLAGIGVDLRVFGVKGDRTFHPKVIILEGSASAEYAAIVGSHNWTAGGLDSNFEASVVVKGRRGESVEDDAFATELDSLWSTYRSPTSPLSSGHLHVVDADFISTWAPKIAEDATPARDESHAGAAAKIFSSLTAPRAPRTRAPRTQDSPPPTTQVPATSLPKTLFLEVKGVETGALGEVQLPLDVLSSYFGIQRSDVFSMRLEHPDGTVEKNKPIAVYPNSTFRISSPKFREIGKDKRPMILKFKRVDTDAFELTIFLSGSKKFRKAERRLDKGGGPHKRWGIR